MFFGPSTPRNTLPYSLNPLRTILGCRNDAYRASPRISRINNPIFVFIFHPLHSKETMSLAAMNVLLIMMHVHAIYNERRVDDAL